MQLLARQSRSGVSSKPGSASVRSTNVRTLSFYVHRVQRLACGHEETISLWTAKAKVGANLGQKYLPDALSIRSKDVYAVIAFANPSSADPDVAVHIGSDAVRLTRRLSVFHPELHRSELAAVLNLPAVDHVID